MLIKTLVQLKNKIDEWRMQLKNDNKKKICKLKLLDILRIMFLSDHMHIRITNSLFFEVIVVCVLGKWDFTVMVI